MVTRITTLAIPNEQTTMDTKLADTLTTRGKNAWACQYGAIWFRNANANKKETLQDHQMSIRIHEKYMEKTGNTVAIALSKGYQTSDKEGKIQQKSFFTFGSYRDIEHFSKNATDADNMYEIVPGDKPRFFFQDLEWVLVSLDTPKNVIDENIQFVLEYLKNKHEVILDRSAIQVSVSDGFNTTSSSWKDLQKGSAHIKYPVIFRTNAECKIFADNVAQKIIEASEANNANNLTYKKNGTLETVMDGAVYTTNRNFRMLYMSKCWEKRPLVPLDSSKAISDHMLVVYDPKDLDKYPIVSDVLAIVPLESRSKPKASQKETSSPPSSFDGVRDERFAPSWEDFEMIIRGLNIPRHFGPHTHPLWTKLGWAMDNVGRTGGYRKKARELFDELSQTFALVYSGDSIIDLFDKAREDGAQLGFRYVLDVLKEDNDKLFKTFSNQLRKDKSNEITDDNIIKIIHHFLASRFKCRIPQISAISIFNSNDTQHVIIDSADVYCPMTNTEHSSIYYVIGRENTKEKCRHDDCKNKHGLLVDYTQYPEELSKALQLLFTGDNRERDTLRKVLLTYKKDDDLKKMTLQLGKKMQCPVRGTSYQLPSNTYCPIHGCCHDNPENCIIHSVDFQKLAVGCRTDLSRVYPADGVSVPKNVVNIFIQNNYNNATPVDAYDDLLCADYAQDNMPFFANNHTLHQVFISALSGQQYDIAVLVHALWGEEFRFFDEKWYRFQNHIWEALEGVPKLRHILSSDLCKTFQPVQVFYRDNSGLSRAKDKKASIDRMIANLKSAGFKDSVMKEVKEVFQIQNEGFAREVNKANLLPFTNGVLDLDTYEFREGKPEDKMTKSTHVEYKEYVESNERCNELHHFFVNIMPNESVRSFLLKVSALAMTRETKHQLFTVLTGCGANGKSIYMDLMSAMLGDFAVTAPVDMLTGKREASHACNESLVALDGARMAAFNEPSVSGVIQADTMKVLAGGRDKISARGLHEKQRTFIPVFKMFLACNVIPRMSEDTLAVWRRVKVINFPMKFCDDPDPENKFESLIDEDIGDTKLPEWAPYLASYLLIHLKALRKHGLKKPHEVECATRDYRQESDAYADFWTDCMVHHGDRNRAVNRTAVKAVFKDWLKRHRFPDMSYAQMKAYWDSRMTHMDTTRACGKVKGYVEWDVKESLKTNENKVDFLPDL